LMKWIHAIPDIYLDLLVRAFGWQKELVVSSLKRTIDIITDGKSWIHNPYILSERYLVNRFTKNKRTMEEYSNFYEFLWSWFTSCSLELFHLFSILESKKMQFFDGLTMDDQVALIIFVPDACAWSAMKSWLFFSRLHPNLTIFSITQNTTDGHTDEILITKINHLGYDILN
jgi:hypothetical protein